jgi:hypothetical protein
MLAASSARAQAATLWRHGSRDTRLLVRRNCQLRPTPPPGRCKALAMNDRERIRCQFSSQTSDTPRHRCGRCHGPDRHEPALRGRGSTSREQRSVIHTRAEHRAAKPGEQFYTDSHRSPSASFPHQATIFKVTPRRNTSGANGGCHARFATLPR